MKRILFVDDEPMVLEGLQRMLRPQRAQWEMRFASGGPEALDMLDSTPFDVVVTDMRMPGMDGAQLLEMVRGRFPSVIRVVLSGYVEREAALRAAPVAHQFLAKPCNPDALRAAIERCCGFVQVLSNETARRVVGAVGQLPTLPGTCASLIAALQDPETPLARIGDIIEQDVAMTAKVLQLVNSAFFGLLREVTTVQAAVGFLGLDTLQQLVLSVEIFRTFHPRIPGFRLEDFERHSRLTANLATQLPVHLTLRPTTAVAALLHDAGKLVLASRLPEQFELSVRMSLEQNRSLYAVEEEVTGVGHAEIGAYLLGLWGLPDVIVDAVSRHHHPVLRPGYAPDLDVLGAVHIADALAFAAQPGESGDAHPACALLDEGYVRSLGMMEQIPRWSALARDLAGH